MGPTELVPCGTEPSKSTATHPNEQVGGDPRAHGHAAAMSMTLGLIAFVSGPVALTLVSVLHIDGIAYPVFGFAGLIGMVCGVLACVLSSVARRRIAASGGTHTGRGMALTGLVLGGTAVILSFFLALLGFGFWVDPGYS